MKTAQVSGCLHLMAHVPRNDRPPPFDDDVGFSESFVETVLERYTRPGDIVVDPFAGFGTTIAVAERMGRIGYGVELLADRADFIRGRVAHPERVFTGDARSVGQLDLPRRQILVVIAAVHDEDRASAEPIDRLLDPRRR